MTDGDMLSPRAARHQALAASGATIIAFIGVCHEAVGATLFPWGPAFLGGPVGWHAVGLFVIVAGLATLGGTLRLYRFPVVPFALFAAVVGAFFVVATALLHRQFHVFALTACVAGLVTAYAHPRAARRAAPSGERLRPTSRPR